jgi:hypothetical protein
LCWKKVGANGAGGGEDDAALHGVFEFANVAGPLIVHQDAHGFGGERTVFGAVLFRVELEEVCCEERDIFAAGAEGRQLQADDVEAVEEVFAEAALADGVLQVDVGGGDDADVDLDLLHAAEMHEAAVLEDAQNLGLHVHAHGADLVEEESTAVGDFEETLFCGDGGGEGTFDVAEEGGFQ